MRRDAPWVMLSVAVIFAALLNFSVAQTIVDGPEPFPEASGRGDVVRLTWVVDGERVTIVDSAAAPDGTVTWACYDNQRDCDARATYACGLLGRTVRGRAKLTKCLSDGVLVDCCSFSCEGGGTGTCKADVPSNVQ